MDEVTRLIVVIGLAALALTLAGGGVVWSLDPTRRIRRSFRRVLGDAPHALLVARGRGKGVACNFASNQVGVAWDAGAWCLVYRLDELIGAELVIDGRVEGRVHRGEERRALDRLSGGERQVRLRLIFSDPRYPEFNLDLWLPEDAGRKRALSSEEAVQEANRWLALVEALHRRPSFRRPVMPSAAEEAPDLPFEAGEARAPVR
jgi:hypothetical protein